MPQDIKKSAPVKKAVMPAKKETVAERLNKVNPVSKAKYEAAMQKQWKSRPENQMKSSPKASPKEAKATPMKERTIPYQMKPASNANEIKIAQRASYMTEKAPKKMMKTEATPKKNK